jgi:hypothetical protein
MEALWCDLIECYSEDFLAGNYFGFWTRHLVQIDSGNGMCGSSVGC